MAKDTLDRQTGELNLTVTKDQAKIVIQAVELQIKSHERAERAQRVAGREAIADTLAAEASKLKGLIARIESGITLLETK